ncbi:MAG: hypothetical protein HY663_00320 [Chloroflexi bacterium]|nr:hypothetical protein [Chloroflexota bacterium]
MEGDVVRTAKKLSWLLFVAILVFLSLPGHNVLADGTTVEVNLGKTITLNVGKNQSDIPLDVKGIVVSGNATGLAAFDFTLSWDAAVIRVETVRGSPAAASLGWAFTIGAIDNTAGAVRIVGTTTQQPYSKADLTLAYLGITAVGSPGKKTAITVTITDLVDNKLQQIALRSAVNALVEIIEGAIQQTVTEVKAEPKTEPLPEAKTEEGGLPVKSEPGIVNVPGSANETGVSTKESIPKSENNKVKPATNEGTTAAKPTTNEGAATAAESTPAQPVNWGLIGGIAVGIVVIGGVVWLVLKRRTT